MKVQSFLFAIALASFAVGDPLQFSGEATNPNEIMPQEPLSNEITVTPEEYELNTDELENVFNDDNIEPDKSDIQTKDSSRRLLVSRISTSRRRAAAVRRRNAALARRRAAARRAASARRRNAALARRRAAARRAASARRRNAALARRRAAARRAASARRRASAARRAALARRRASAARRAAAVRRRNASLAKQRAAAARRAALARRRAAAARRAALARRRAAAARRAAARRRNASLAKQRAARRAALARRRAAEAVRRRNASLAKQRAAAARRAAATKKTFPVKMTVDNEFDLFINGKKVGSGNSWTRTYSFNPSFSKVTTIAIDGRDRGGPAAFIGVFNGKPTKANDWKCQNFPRGLPRNWMSPNFDDSKWPKAVSFGNNNQNTIWRRVGRGKRPGIPNNAEWIWTRNNNNHNRVVCRMSFFSEFQHKKLTIRDGYNKIARHLTKIAQEVNKDMKSSNRLDTKTRRNLDAYNARLVTLNKAIVRSQKQLAAAKKFNSNYVKKFNVISKKKGSLLASLKRQRRYISIEHAYINKMETEAVSLKPTSAHYKSIQTEIQQMRNQMRKEIRDIETAYARAMSSLVKQKHTLSKHRNTTSARILHLRRLITQHNIQLRQFQKLVSNIHKTQGVNSFTIKALNHLSKATAEFQTHVRNMSHRNVMLNFPAGYSQCVSETNRIRSYYRKAKCSKK